MSSGNLLNKVDGHFLVDPSEYQMMVRSLQYRTLTQFDIYFIVNKLYQFMALHTNLRMLVTKRFLQYVNVTLLFGLALHKREVLNLTESCDVDCASYPYYCRSTCVHFVYFDENLVLWHNTKQKVLFKSST